jgi:hypothetical protein
VPGDPVAWSQPGSDPAVVENAWGAEIALAGQFTHDHDLSFAGRDSARRQISVRELLVHMIEEFATVACYPATATRSSCGSSRRSPPPTRPRTALVCDNYATTHKHPEARKWLAANPRVGSQAASGQRQPAAPRPARVGGSPHPGGAGRRRQWRWIKLVNFPAASYAA